LKGHPYIRAYLAGIAPPTLFLPIVLTAVTVARFAFSVQLPLERVVIFGMAVVPNLWGLWNILYVRLSQRHIVPLGLLGAALPLLLAPMGAGLMRLLELPIPVEVIAGFPVAFPVILIAYYLAWKYLVAFLNALLGVA
jgi:hypothetical protein